MAFFPIRPTRRHRALVAAGRSIAAAVVVLVLLVGPAPLSALEPVLPQFFDVRGVAADDVLNVREGPGVHFPIIGTLAPERRDVEVLAVSDNGRWGLINVDERRGWVAMRYLAPGRAPAPLPFGLSCGGTEPFWSLTLRRNHRAQARWMFLDPARARARYRSVWSAAPAGSGLTEPVALALQDEATATGVAATGIVRRAACTDGMSDRLYGLSIDLVVTAGSERTYLQGCCALSTE